MTDASPPPSGSGGRGVIVTAAIILVVALVAIGFYAWETLGASEMTVHGYVALVLGVVGTAGLGIGLMVLVFYSHRYGYDERVGGRDEPSERR